ncbi:MAG: S41 family peptidase, partial [Turicibacter sp.]|nr:S41 family peptidase [Turicibacter sp.]
ACGADEGLEMAEEPPIYEVYEELVVEGGEDEPIIEVAPPQVGIFARPLAEYLKDLDFMYYIITNNFPLINVIERRAGIDIHQLFADARLALENVHEMPSDDDFWMFLSENITWPVGGLGHFSLPNPRGLLNIYGPMVQLGHIELLPHVEIFDNPSTRAFYNLTDDDFIFDHIETPEDAQVPATGNVEMLILTENIAYARIRTFYNGFMQYDSAVLLDFYREVADFEHLIIDIRSNAGGAVRHFLENVMSPNISEPLTARFYQLFSSHPHNMMFLESRLSATDWEIRPIDEELLERLVYLNHDDLELLDSYFVQEVTVMPSQPEPIFGGKIWLVVDRLVSSSAEAATQMTQETGFATIVGEPTGGDGIGFDSLIATLPNTGIAVWYSSLYGTDALGRNNQEFGTTPDILLNMEFGTITALLDIIRNWE